MNGGGDKAANTYATAKYCGVIHTILGNQDAKDDDFQAERQ